MEIDEGGIKREKEPLEPKESPDIKPAGQASFFRKIFGFLLGAGDPEQEKKHLLREIGKLLRKQRLKFYKTRSETVEPALAKYFHEFYRIMGPAQTLVKHADYSGVLKQIIIENTLPTEAQNVRERLTEEAIRTRAEKMALKELATQIKDEIVGFISCFDIERVRQINHTFSLLTGLVDLIHFDYYFMLKKFDSSLPEGNFYYTPKYEAINSEYVSEDLKEFVDIISTIEDSEEWTKVLDILKEYRGVEVIPLPSWKKILARIRELKRSRILLYMVQYIEKNPYHKVTPHDKSEKIVESYLSKLKTQTELSLQKISKEKHATKVDELTKQIFGTASVSRLKNYTDKANVPFSKKMLGGFIFVQPLNYLKAFLLDYLKKDIRQIIDLFLIKGKWAANIVSTSISDSFHELIKISDRITEFDDSVAEDSQNGAKFRSYLHKIDKDKNAQKVLRQMLKEINDIAKALIHEAAANLIIIGKSLKQIIDDHTASPHELVINWKEIELAADKNLNDFMVSVYKKLYYMVKLLQIFSKEE